MSAELHAHVAPLCPHFGVCGGCQLQDVSYAEQLRMKQDVLARALAEGGVANAPAIAVHGSPQPWGYRNRIRLHVLCDGDALAFGYRRRGSQDILPIMTCPIAAPVLWAAAEQLLALAQTDANAGALLRSVREVELFCDGEEARVQITLLTSSRDAALRAPALARAAEALRARVPALHGFAVTRIDPRSGQMRETLASWGSDGLMYAVGDDRHWVPRGAFFQVNRFLATTLLQLAVAGQRGEMAWDLFAGVGLFARPLARSYARVVAVEANPYAAGALRAAFVKTPQHAVVEDTTLAFLERAAVQRERPQLIVADPPRAGLGERVCALLVQIAAAQLVYVSCNPLTLARDLAQLQAGGYTLDAVHVVDLFPQTSHQEAVVHLRR
jgi:23S rRNA (uracil1939-C5)-methyltransferase